MIIMRILNIGIIILYLPFFGNAQRISPEEYIAQYKDIAIREMKRMGIPASITLAQGLLETESGNSELVKKSNNHFGIKCKNTWTGPSVKHDDDLSGECFRAYSTPEESFRDHSNFLRSNARYAALFKLEITDYKGWAYGLKRAGYATNPYYPQTLIKNVEQYNLQQYTLQALNEMAGIDSVHIGSDSLTELSASKADSISAAKLASLTKIVMINNSRSVWAAQGITLLAVANANHIPLNKLLAFNEWVQDGVITCDQYVFLEPKSMTGPFDYYTIEPGETLHDVAQKTGMQLKYLLSYNNLTTNVVATPGTVLMLKPGLKVPVIQQEEPVPLLTHIVAPKETLYTIAKKYKVTVQQLKDWNKLNGDGLRIGQKLYIGPQ
jgi:LysM repeat protein